MRQWGKNAAASRGEWKQFTKQRSQCERQECGAIHQQRTEEDEATARQRGSRGDSQRTATKQAASRLLHSIYAAL